MYNMNNQNIKIKYIHLKLIKHPNYIFSNFVKQKNAIITKTMKKIEAIIRKSKFSAVKSALHDVGVNFFSYWDVTGLGNEKEGHVYRGVSYSTSDIQRRYLSIVVNDDFEKATINAILKSGATGQVGDGKIFVSDIKECYRIRTGEKGGQTLN